MDSIRKTESDTAIVDRHMSVPEAARAIGRAPATVRSLALQGELAGELVAGRIVITRESVEKYLARERQREAEEVARARNRAKR